MTVRTVLLAVVVLAAPLVVLGQSPPPRGANVAVMLNEAMEAYRADDLPRASRLLNELEQAAPGNLAVAYYQGLVAMRQGLQASAARRYDEAQREYARARDYLRRVYEGDPQVRPTEVALEFGIAQLAAGDPEDARRDSARFLRVHQAARSTLESYVAGPGAEDRYGFFFLGIACWRVGYYAEERGEEEQRMYAAADAAFDQAIELGQAQLAGDPRELARFRSIVQYYQGLVLLARGGMAERERGIDVLTQVGASEAAPPDMRSNADTLVRQAKELPTTDEPGVYLLQGTAVGPVRLEGRLEVGAGYDTNVILLGDRADLPRGVRRNEDFFYGLRASFDLTRSLTKSELAAGESLLLGIGFETFHQWQPRINQYDINDYSPRLYANWEFAPDWFAGFQYDYSYNMLGHKPFISSHRITPVLSKVWRDGDTPGRGTERGRTDVFYSYDYRNYLDRLYSYYLDRDGNYHMVGARHTVNLARAREMWSDYYASRSGSHRESGDGDRWASAFLGYTWGNDSTTGSEFDRYTNAIQAGVNVPLPLRLMFDFTLGFSWDNYWQPSLYDRARRERFDFVQTYGIGLTYTLVGRGEVETMRSLQVDLRGSAEWSDYDSNITTRRGEHIYEYDRGVYGLKLIVSF